MGANAERAISLIFGTIFMLIGMTQIVETIVDMSLEDNKHKRRRRKKRMRRTKHTIEELNDSDTEAFIEKAKRMIDADSDTSS